AQRRFGSNQNKTMNLRVDCFDASEESVGQFHRRQLLRFQEPPGLHDKQGAEFTSHGGICPRIKILAGSSLRLRSFRSRLATASSLATTAQHLSNCSRGTVTPARFNISVTSSSDS